MWRADCVHKADVEELRQRLVDDVSNTTIALERKADAQELRTLASVVDRKADLEIVADKAAVERLGDVVSGKAEAKEVPTKFEVAELAQALKQKANIEEVHLLDVFCHNTRAEIASAKKTVETVARELQGKACAKDLESLQALTQAHGKKIDTWERLVDTVKSEVADTSKVSAVELEQLALAVSRKADDESLAALRQECEQTCSAVQEHLQKKADLDTVPTKADLASVVHALECRARASELECLGRAVARKADVETVCDES